MSNSGNSGSHATRRKIALALQGGGAHGAFTWGVLKISFNAASWIELASLGMLVKFTEEG